MSTETLMTDQAENTTEGQTASEQVTQQAATGAAADDQQQQASTEQATESQSAEGGEAKGKEAEGAPEAYEFKAPDGQEFSPEVLGAFSEAAKESGLSQEAAQKMLDKLAPAFVERQAHALEAARTQWETDAKADKEFGGDKLSENLSLAKKALDQFGTPELRALLNQSGLGNHPEIIRAFYRAGKAISEDRVITGQGGAAAQNGAREFYAASNMNP
jgi:hypothetical protein